MNKDIHTYMHTYQHWNMLAKLTSNRRSIRVSPQCLKVFKFTSRQTLDDDKSRVEDCTRDLKSQIKVSDLPTV